MNIQQREAKGTQFSAAGLRGRPPTGHDAQAEGGTCTLAPPLPAGRAAV